MTLENTSNDTSDVALSQSKQLEAVARSCMSQKENQTFYSRDYICIQKYRNTIDHDDGNQSNVKMVRSKSSPTVAHLTCSLSHR
jgi:hypothetical protein